MLKHTEQGCWMIVGDYLHKVDRKFNYTGFSHSRFLKELKARNQQKMKANV